MGVNITSKGYYYGYRTNLIINTSGGTLSIDEFDYEINSDDSPNPSVSTVTIYNIADVNLNKIERGNAVEVYAGATDIYGLACEGVITKISDTKSRGQDRTTVLTIREGVSYANSKLNANYKGLTVKTNKKGVKRVSLTFKKNVKARAIIAKLCKASGIKIYHKTLAENKRYKRGYTINGNPYNALKKIVSDCKSLMYYRKGHLVIDDYKTDNPYNEHLYLSTESGLLSQPTINDDSKNRLYTLQCFDDLRVSAGSTIQVQSNNLNGLYRVKSVKHTHSGDFTMEVVIYA